MSLKLVLRLYKKSNFLKMETKLFNIFEKLFLESFGGYFDFETRYIDDFIKITFPRF